MARRSIAAFAFVLLIGATGCTGSSRLSDEDRLTLDRLAPIAARDAGLAGDPRAERHADAPDASDASLEGVECWAPSQHPIDRAEAGFRVICRVHFDEAGQQRYRDVICIGDADSEPLADYCYPWAPYSDMPEFEDHPAFEA